MSSISFSSSIHASNNINLTDPFSQKNLENELQEAFNVFDHDRIRSLIEEGANPNQEIELTKSGIANLLACFFKEDSTKLLLEGGDVDEWAQCFPNSQDLFSLQSEVAFEQNQAKLGLKVREIQEASNNQTLTEEMLKEFYVFFTNVILVEEPDLYFLYETFRTLPACVLAVLAKKPALLDLMIQEGAEVQNLKFHGVSDCFGLEAPYQFLNIFDSVGLEMAQSLLKAGSSWDLLVALDDDFLEDLSNVKPENVDDILRFLSEHFDFQKLLKENKEGETYLTRVLKLGYCDLTLLTYLLEKLPHYAMLESDCRLLSLLKGRVAS